MSEHLITVRPNIRDDGAKHPNAFDVEFAGAVLCVSETPFFDAARKLMAAGLAVPGDTLAMRHAGSDHVALRGLIGVAAGLTVSDKPSGRRVYLDKFRGKSNPPGIDDTKQAARCAETCPAAAKD